MDRTVTERRATRIRPSRGGVATAPSVRAWAVALLLLGLGACAATQPALTTPADSYAVAGGNFGRPWGGQPPMQLLEDSATIGRLRGEAPEGQLMPESGNVWPGPLPPRTTLANPDAALRGVPEYGTPGTSIPPPTSSLPPVGPPRGLPSSAATSPPPVARPTASSPLLNIPPAAPAGTMPPRADGRFIMTPNGPVVTTGGTDRIQSAITPGGQSAIVTRDGNTTTVTPIGGVPQPGVPLR